ncbi:hypothetical protein Lal_00046981 [Lupinus albus]|uniref:Putative F-box domain, FBD domain, leucine-rich repeat domain, L domain-containing protein n=1 Tax=Lupinus albus TaxID=3870 RepID=A0A6A4QX09_LUPAL|nr:putative F-box domain, FBD domain, leucine-rich repeat domain, L domain-containing protein [Lupinus albus]KAF1878314.1 hypothetical protein Lal_00046981 [Lupinus albus]
MACNNSDMFSPMHEALLVPIVSYLPFKEAARTCTLSKQWKDVWKCTKSIEFNELFFVKYGDDSDDETRKAQRRVFLNFITHWIRNYQEKVVNKFSLKVSAPENILDVVERCVAFATQHATKELGLDFSDPKWEETDFEIHDALFELPNHVYGTASIELLKLYSCTFSLSKLLNFKALKDVSLGWIELRIDTVKILLFTCNTIENLSLKKCWNLDHFDLSDKKLGLRRLVIDKCHFDCDYLAFSAPNLKFLKYSGLVGGFDIDIQQDVMEEAEIDFALMFEFDEFGNELYTLLEHLYSVRKLTVDSFLLQVIQNGDETMRIQCGLNVRHLTMKTQLHPQELCGIRFLLFSSPMLEKLTFEIDPQIILPDYKPPYDVDLKNFWHGPQIIYRCLIKTLKVVEVNKFRGTMDELCALFYLIKVGNVLEKMIISVEKDEHVERHCTLARTLLPVPPASKKLEISIK